MASGVQARSVRQETSKIPLAVASFAVWGVSEAALLASGICQVTGSWASPTLAAIANVALAGVSGVSEKIRPAFSKKNEAAVFAWKAIHMTATLAAAAGAMTGDFGTKEIGIINIVTVASNVALVLGAGVMSS